MCRLSLVVITRNRRRLLERSLSRHVDSLPTDARVSDLIVVDNGSSDGTSEWIRSVGSGARVVSLEQNIGPAARLLGSAIADTRHIAFSDDDSWWEAGALDAASDILDESPHVGLLAGSAYVGPEARPDPMNRVLALSPLRGPDDEISVLGFMAFAAVARKAALGSCAISPLGMGAEERLIALDLAAAGWTLSYRPELRAHHHPQPVGDRLDRDLYMARNAMAIAMARRKGSGVLSGLSSAMRGMTLQNRSKAVRRLSEVAPWVIRNRRPVSAPLEARLRAIESERFRS